MGCPAAPYSCFCQRKGSGFSVCESLFATCSKSAYLSHPNTISFSPGDLVIALVLLLTVYSRVTHQMAFSYVCLDVPSFFLYAFRLGVPLAGCRVPPVHMSRPDHDLDVKELKTRGEHPCFCATCVTWTGSTAWFPWPYTRGEPSCCFTPNCVTSLNWLVRLIFYDVLYYG